MTFASHSQNGEDIVLWRALRHVRHGRWIEVGANDPDIDSVTRAFSDAGWTGINVEPQRSIHSRLVDRRPGDVNLNLAVSDSGGELRLFEVVEATGLTTDDALAAERYRRSGFDVREVSVPTRTLASIWDEHVDGDVHFLKIDVEGGEAAVLRSAAFDRQRPWVIVIEAVEPVVVDGSAEPEPGAIPAPATTHGAWEHLITDHDYRFVLFDGLNRFYVAEERASDLADVVAIPVNVLDQTESASSRRRVEAATARQAELEAERDAAVDEVDAMRRSMSWRITAPLRRVRRTRRT